VASATAAAKQASTVNRGPASSFILSDGTVDYYELLGVDDVATPAQIKMAYRTLAKASGGCPRMPCLLPSRPG
jgi:hypothetical protein